MANDASCWRALHAYSASLSPLIVDVVGPFLSRHEATLDHGFWERHYAGGPHVRVRLRASPEVLDALLPELRGELEAWMRQNRTEPSSHYSPEISAALLRLEGIEPSTEDLEYHSDLVLEQPYPERGKRFASAAARGFAEDFFRKRGPLALDLMRGPEPIREQMFRFYLARALFVGEGSYPPGSVSFKSHWEGFAASYRSKEIVERVGVAYAADRPRLLAIAAEVLQEWNVRRFGGNTPLCRWWDLLAWASSRGRSLLERGEHLAADPMTPEDLAAWRQRAHAALIRRSEFVEVFLSDETFVAAIRDDVKFQTARALVNLLYQLVAAVGLTALDKVLLCHHTFRVVEDTCRCNLTDRLRNSISDMSERRRYRAGIADHPP